MKVRYGKEVANHSGPESCSDAREGVAEALTGETGRPGIELRNPNSGMPTLLSEAEGNTVQGATVIGGTLSAKYSRFPKDRRCRNLRRVAAESGVAQRTEPRPLKLVVPKTFRVFCRFR
jgi:hypothetical protein